MTVLLFLFWICECNMLKWKFGSKMADSAELSQSSDIIDLLGGEYSEDPGLPKVNCPEKIIFCIDLSEECDKTHLTSKDKSYSLRTIWRNCIELFVYNKHLLNPYHEFGVILLRDTAIWSLDFTNDPKAVCSHVNNLLSTGDTYPAFDITSLYSSILENVKLPSSDTDVAPPYVVRALFMYGRSYSMPVYKTNLDSYELLMNCPYFFLDVFYAHETPSQKNECHSTFEVLVDICPKPKAMVVDVCKNVTRVFDNMGKLLAHPLFRVVQEKQDHRLLCEAD